MIIKQLSKAGTNKGNLQLYDFCRSKSWDTDDKWLNNRAGNGWNYENPNNVYTNFILRLIK